MKKLRLLILLLLVATGLRAQSPIVLSVADLLPNYGLDSTYVRDTASAQAHLDAQPQDYATLALLCVKLRNDAQEDIFSYEDTKLVKDGGHIDTCLVACNGVVYVTDHFAELSCFMADLIKDIFKGTVMPQDYSFIGSFVKKKNEG